MNTNAPLSENPLTIDPQAQLIVGNARAKVIEVDKVLTRLDGDNSSEAESFRARNEALRQRAERFISDATKTFDDHNNITEESIVPVDDNVAPSVADHNDEVSFKERFNNVASEIPHVNDIKTTPDNGDNLLIDHSPTTPAWSNGEIVKDDAKSVLELPALEVDTDISAKLSELAADLSRLLILTESISARLDKLEEEPLDTPIIDGNLLKNSPVSSNFREVLKSYINACVINDQLEVDNLDVRLNEILTSDNDIEFNAKEVITELLSTLGEAAMEKNDVMKHLFKASLAQTGPGALDDNQRRLVKTLLDLANSDQVAPNPWPRAQALF